MCRRAPARSLETGLVHARTAPAALESSADWAGTEHRAAGRRPWELLFLNPNETRRRHASGRCGPLTGEHLFDPPAQVMHGQVRRVDDDVRATPGCPRKRHAPLQVDLVGRPCPPPWDVTAWSPQTVRARVASSASRIQDGRVRMPRPQHGSNRGLELLRGDALRESRPRDPARDRECPRRLPPGRPPRL